MEFDKLSSQVIGFAIEVHRQLGSGLLESTYEKCLSLELANAGIIHQTQYALPVVYKGTAIDNGFRVDLLINNQLIVELKSVEKFHKLHEAQLLTYMKLANIKTGLLINFNSLLLKNGIKRFVL
ncbi:MAG: GxxExxY protein [Gammaproteobacteria bacterium]|nr:GxxExxY protein [Gammaproteobacteria bacterium]MBD3775746.1 GxxExxY protein [Thiotrichales bacterium]